MIKARMRIIMIPAMMRNNHGLEPLPCFSGDAPDVFMDTWMHDSSLRFANGTQ
jgi:hypothetical protein